MTKEIVLFDSLKGPHVRNVPLLVEERRRREREAVALMDRRTPLERSREKVMESRMFRQRLLAMTIDCWRPRKPF